MKNKWLFISILIVAEILVLAAVVFVVWQGVTETNLGAFSFRFSNPDLFSAESEEEWQFEAGEISELVLESSGGDVIIEASQSEEILVTAYKTAWHSTKAKAQAELEDLSVIVTQTGNKIVIKFRREPSMLSFGPQQTDIVDFIISVPEGLEINTQTNFGDISLTGKFGDAMVSTDFGNLDLSGIQGNLEAKSNSGDITAKGITGEDSRINMSSDFGDVTLEKSDCSSVEIHSNSGSVKLNDVNATEKIDLSSDFGEVEFTKGSTDILSMETNSGNVSLSGVTVVSILTIRNGFGDIVLEKVSANTYDLDTNSGKIDLGVAGGSIKAVSDFGDLEISSTGPATLDLYTNSGTIEFSGPLGMGPHSLVTDFGDISVYLPKDTAITFDLETDFGKLKSEFPITLEGDGSQDHWRGTINDGGAELTANTNSGDISFEIFIR
jgi:DUF4097 and DUF4098 domain-containing protein YvlB